MLNLSFLFIYIWNAPTEPDRWQATAWFIKWWIVSYIWRIAHVDNENLAWKWLTDVSRDSEAVFNWGVLRFRQNGSSLDMGNALQSFIIAPEAKKLDGNPL